MKFPIKDFFSEYDQIRRNLRILSHLLKKFLIENFIFCALGEIIPVHFFNFLIWYKVEPYALDKPRKVNLIG